MTTSVRLCLSYDPLNGSVYHITVLIAHVIKIVSAGIRMVDTDVVNDVTSTRQSVITRVVIRFL